MIVVLGSFDGFHKGHASLFERAKELAAPLKQEWGAVTFDPHPGIFMDALSTTLFTLRERELIRHFLEIPHLVTLKFDDELAHFSPRLFWEFLRDNVRIHGIVVGRDFRFGYRRTGDVALLEEYCREMDIPFVAVDVLEHLGIKISSSTIRRHVESGQCDLVIRELGYPWFIWSEIVHGQGRGTTLGFPTANFHVPRTKLLPADGVYAVALPVAGKWKAGALSVGKNPTFGDIDEVRVEVFILDYSGNLYEESLPVFFLSRLRPQEKFDTVEELTLQIQADVERSKSVFKRSFEVNPNWYSGFLMGYTKILNQLGYSLPHS